MNNTCQVHNRTGALHGLHELKRLVSSILSKDRPCSASERLKARPPSRVAAFQPLISLAELKTRGKERARALAAISMMLDSDFDDLIFLLSLKAAEGKKGRALSDRLCSMGLLGNRAFGLSGAHFIMFMIDSVPDRRLGEALGIMERITSNRHFGAWMYVTLEVGFKRGLGQFRDILKQAGKGRELLIRPFRSLDSFVSNPSFAGEWLIPENVSCIVRTSIGMHLGSGKRDAEMSQRLFNGTLKGADFAPERLEISPQDRDNFEPALPGLLYMSYLQ